MATVYLVSTGSYSDYSVQAIFSTREKAQAFIDRFPAEPHTEEFNEIREIDLDPDLPPPIPDGLKRFYVGAEFGTAIRVAEIGDSCSNNGESASMFNAYVYARDIDHAKKIGVERIQAEKRRKAFEMDQIRESTIKRPWSDAK